MESSRVIRPRLLLTATGCLIAGIALLQLLPVVFGAPVLLVHITWRGVDDIARQQLEQQFRLSERTALANGAWQYVPLEPSTPILRAIVRHPAVAATDGIDRRALRLSPRAPRTPRRGGLVTAPLAAGAVKLAAFILLLGAALLFVAAGAGARIGDSKRYASLVNRVRADPGAAVVDTFAALRRMLERGAQ